MSYIFSDLMDKNLYHPETECNILLQDDVRNADYKMLNNSVRKFCRL